MINSILKKDAEGSRTSGALTSTTTYNYSSTTGLLSSTTLSIKRSSATAVQKINGAGFVAGQNGLPWKIARIAFDALESIQGKKLSTEGLPTVLAERAGFESGRRKLDHGVGSTDHGSWGRFY